MTWHVPGLVWSLDDAELARLAGHQLHLHHVQEAPSNLAGSSLVVHSFRVPHSFARVRG
jgi:hypothetical protein